MAAGRRGLQIIIGIRESSGGRRLARAEAPYFFFCSGGAA
jgi:hypothetical protein